MSRDTSHESTLGQLVPDATYELVAWAIGSDGSRAEIARDSFVTDTLPSDLAQVTFVSSGTSTAPLVMLEVGVFPNGYLGFVA